MEKVIYAALQTPADLAQAFLKLSKIATASSNVLIPPTEIALQTEVYNEGPSLLSKDLKTRMTKAVKLIQSEYGKSGSDNGNDEESSSEVTNRISALDFSLVKEFITIPGICPAILTVVSDPEAAADKRIQFALKMNADSDLCAKLPSWTDTQYAIDGLFYQSFPDKFMGDLAMNLQNQCSEMLMTIKKPLDFIRKNGIDPVDVDDEKFDSVISTVNLLMEISVRLCAAIAKLRECEDELNSELPKDAENTADVSGKSKKEDTKSDGEGD